MAMAGDEQGEQPTSKNATMEGVAHSQSQVSQENDTPQYRQPSAYVMTNPKAARPARKYRKHQTVTVYRENGGWYKADIDRWQEYGTDSWEYQLVDKDGQTIWKDQETWFTEEELDRFKNKMQNAESAMEKGEAGYVERLDNPAPDAAPTSPTLSNSSTKCSNDIDLAIVNKYGLPVGLRWKWPSWGSCNRKRHGKTHRVEVKTRRLNDHARGYPNLAAFLDSDEGFTIYRRFGYLQSRLLLDKQEELRRLEEQLERLELKILKDDDQAFTSQSSFGDEADQHRQILSEIETTFCSYSKLLRAAQQMSAFNKPSDSEYESVGRYMHNRKPLVEDEATWIKHKEDIVTIRPGRDHAWLDDVIEGFLKVCHCKLVDKIFRSEETQKKTEIDPDVVMPGQPPEGEERYELYYTPSRIARLAHGILTLLVLVLLILPIYILYHMVHDVGTQEAYMICIGTLMVFTLAFSTVSSVFTKARRHEVLAAAAAYCAVLVVFLGNVVPPTGNT